jgi:threonine/homoserine/homoserine lactone efflux protein
MTVPPENYLLVPLSVGFAGSLSFGPINLCVVDTTVRHNLRAGIWFAAAAAMVESLQASIALYFGEFYPLFLRKYPWVHLVILVFFVALGIAFLRRSSDGGESKIKEGTGRHFFHGLVIALMNPQGIPFWIFVLAYLQSAQMFEINSNVSQTGLILFLIGVVLGKFAALSLFGMLSNVINRRTAFLQQWTDKITGGILIALGLLQSFQFFLSP